MQNYHHSWAGTWAEIARSDPPTELPWDKLVPANLLSGRGMTALYRADDRIIRVVSRTDADRRLRDRTGTLVDPVPENLARVFSPLTDFAARHQLWVPDFEPVPGPTLGPARRDRLLEGATLYLNTERIRDSSPLYPFPRTLAEACRAGLVSPEVVDELGAAFGIELEQALQNGRTVLWDSRPSQLIFGKGSRGRGIYFPDLDPNYVDRPEPWTLPRRPTPTERNERLEQAAQYAELAALAAYKLATDVSTVEGFARTPMGRTRAALERLLPRFDRQPLRHDRASINVNLARRILEPRPSDKGPMLTPPR